MRQVRKFWTKVGKVVEYKEQQMVNGVKKKVCSSNAETMRSHSAAAALLRHASYAMQCMVACSLSLALVSYTAGEAACWECKDSRQHTAACCM